MRAAHDPPLAQDADADPRADGDEDDVRQPSCRAEPRLTEHVSGSVAVDENGNVEGGFERCAQRNFVGTPEIRTPRTAGRIVVDSRHDHAGSGDSRRDGGQLRHACIDGSGGRFGPGVSGNAVGIHARKRGLGSTEVNGKDGGHQRSAILLPGGRFSCC